MGEKIVSLLKAGQTYAEIRAATGCSKSTINYYAKKLGRAKTGRTYDWAAIQAYHNAGNSRVACQRAFGFCAGSWTNAVKRGDLVARDWRIPVGELLVENRSSRRAHLKIRLLAAGLLTNVCHERGLSESGAAKPCRSRCTTSTASARTTASKTL